MLYKVITEQKITKTVVMVVEAENTEQAMNKVINGDIISAEKSLGEKINELIPIQAEEYE